MTPALTAARPSSMGGMAFAFMSVPLAFTFIPTTFTTTTFTTAASLAATLAVATFVGNHPGLSEIPRGVLYSAYCIEGGPIPVE